MNYKYLYSLILGITSLTAFAQPYAGYVNDRFAVVDAVQWNPSASNASLPWLDVRIGGASVLIDNDYIFIDRGELGSFFADPMNTIQHNEIDGNKTGQFEYSYLGPGFSLSNGKMSYGLATSMKSFFSAREVPQDMADFWFYSATHGPLQGIPHELSEPFQVKFNSYYELAANFSYQLLTVDNHFLAAGVNLKYLMARSGGGTLTNTMNYEVVNDARMVVDNYNGSYAYTGVGNAGSGLGVDIGVTYKLMPKKLRNYTPHTSMSSCNVQDYVLKVGASLIDLGSINYKSNSRYREVSDGSFDWIGYYDFKSRDPEDWVNKIDSLFADDIVDSTDNYKAKLPTTFSLQGDLNMGNSFFLGFHYVQGLTRKEDFGADRLMSIAVMPRIEKSTWAVSMPLSYNSVGDVDLGMMMRIYGLSFGTDDLSGLFMSDWYGLNLFASFRVNVIKSPKCQNGPMPVWWVKEKKDKTSIFQPSSAQKRRDASSRSRGYRHNKWFM